MLYKIVERNNNKGECGERLHALNDLTNCSLVSSTGWKISNSVYKRISIAPSIFTITISRMTKRLISLARVDLISKNFLA